MHVRWTDDAIAELHEIVEFLEIKSSKMAQRVAQEIYDEAEALAVLTNRWRIGPVPGTRERVLPSSGYIITYEVIRDGVFILSIHHAAQDKPRR